MAQLASLLLPGEANGSTTALAATTATSAIVLGQWQKFVICASGDITIGFGLSTGTVATAGATNYTILAGAAATFDLGKMFDEIVVYNPGAGSINYSILKLSIF